MMEDFLTQFFRAFVIGGAICVIGQLLFDIANLTPAHTTSILVISGSILSVFGLYPMLVDFAGFGAMLPIASFGNMLVEGAQAGAISDGFWGILGGMLKQVSAGLSATVIFGFLIALVFKPKS